MFLRILLFSLLILTSACMVGPDYKPPLTRVPSQFVEARESTYAPDYAFYQWWRAFQDPCLDCLLKEASSNNFDIRIAIENIIQAREQFNVQSSKLWPEFDLTAIATRTRNSQNFFSSRAGVLPLLQNFFNLSFDAIWEFDIFGRFQREGNAASDLWQASRFDARSILISTLSEVARQYVIMRAIQQQIILTESIIEIDREALILTEDLQRSGLDTQLQVEALIAALKSDQSSLPPLKTSLRQAIYSIAFLLGRTPESLASAFCLPKPIPHSTLLIPAGLPSDLLRRRPDIRSAERQLAAATEEIGVAVADLFPRIALTGNTFSGGQFTGSVYGYESDRLSKLFESPSRFWSVGTALQWDLIDFGRTFSNIAIQTSLQRQACLTYQQTVIAALHDVEGALVAYFDERERNRDLKAMLQAQRTSLELTEDLLQSGLGNALEVLQAKRTLIYTKINLIGSDQALTMDLIAVYKALGGEWLCFSLP